MKPQLKEINGRYYQEAEVVMIATENKSFLFLNKNKDWLKELNIKIEDHPKERNQHLYIVSNETIKESDWYIRLDNSQIYRAETDIMVINQHVRNGHIKKIIATTNEYIGYTDIRVSPVKNFCIYPRPSDSFIKKYIEEYNKANQITKVLVEYESFITGQCNCQCHDGKTVMLHMIACCHPETILQLKIDSNNQITIKKVKPELYTREEVLDLIEDAMMSLHHIPLNKHPERGIATARWIKENL